MPECKELMQDLGLDPMGLTIDMSEAPASRIRKIMGKCLWCRVLRTTYFDAENGDVIPAKCPLPEEPIASLCAWGGRNNLPLGEE